MLKKKTVEITNKHSAESKSKKKKNLMSLPKEL